jgi:hypothetical protein
MKNSLIFLFLSLVGMQLTRAQEVLSDLSSNAVLSEPRSSGTKHGRPASDTLSLPFLDDFSREGIYPGNTLWVDSNVYINDDYPLNQPTVGVATFDGINKHGVPYEPNNPLAWGKADSLTSRPINLYDYEENNIIKRYNRSDSLFLSFYYQAKGLGNGPDPEDSLVLQFRVPGKDWVHVLSLSPDTADTLFRKALITITDTSFFKKGFQFRFLNYSTLSGNLDHWHIDYVYLNKNKSINQYVKDVAFINRQKSMLKTYQSMPWSHYTTAEKRTQFTINLRNLSSPAEQPLPVPYAYGIYSPYVSTLTATPQIEPDSDTSLTYSFPFDFTPSGSTDDIEFEISHLISPSPNVVLSNDTIRFFQRFSNYFAYDDGTAENGYGVNVNLAKIAYRYTLTHSDTLRGLGIFFNRLINNLSERTFRIIVWKSLSPEDSIYTTGRFQPVYNGINGFHFYGFEKPVPVSGTFYIGIQQFTADILNIGFDRNTDAHTNLFYHRGDNWYRSNIKGSVMMRPYLGKFIPAAITENDVTDGMTIYPNPASERLFLRIRPGMRNARAEIHDLLGRLRADTEISSGMIDVSGLPNGLYLLRVRYDNSFSKTVKLIISRDE